MYGPDIKKFYIFVLIYPDTFMQYDNMMIVLLSSNSLRIRIVNLKHRVSGLQICRANKSKLAIFSIFQVLVKTIFT